MADKRPVFGCVPSGVASRARSAAYAVIRDEDGRVATVGSDSHRFLPGGGSHPRETVAQTVAREVLEELGCRIVLRESIGTAIQHFFSSDDSCWYTMEAAFVRAELAGDSSTRHSNGIVWLRQDQAEELLFHACHVWALRS
jgi:NUDIX domain.